MSFLSKKTLLTGSQVEDVRRLTESIGSCDSYVSKSADSLGLLSTVEGLKDGVLVTTDISPRFQAFWVISALFSLVIYFLLDRRPHSFSDENLGLGVAMLITFFLLIVIYKVFIELEHNRILESRF